MEYRRAGMERRDAGRLSKSTGELQSPSGMFPLPALCHWPVTRHFRDGAWPLGLEPMADPFASALRIRLTTRFDPGRIMLGW